MTDSVAAIYNREDYPSMSHPTGHPSIMAASAIFGGLRTTQVPTSRILEIGCASGHHILPIAAAFPDASITAVDLSNHAIEKAQSIAQSAKITNAQFLCADIKNWRPSAHQYDYIIAHGFFSWVDDEAKSALLDICQHALTPNGVAMISYNTQPGWALRQPLREMTNALRHMPACKNSSILALDLIESAMEGTDTDYGKYLISLIKDAKAKGEQQLKFDDLGPINDPCYFSQFVQWCQAAGLKYVSESDIALSNPAMLPEGAKSLLPNLRNDPLLQQQLADFFTGRTFRTSLICRADANLWQPTWEEVAEFSIELLMPIPATGNPITDRIAEVIHQEQPDCVPMRELLADIQTCEPEQAVTVILQLAQLGILRLRSIPYRSLQSMPEHPRLSLLNEHYLKAGLSIVDAMHNPCKIAPSDRKVLLNCNGINSFDDIMRQCADEKQVQSAHALLQFMNDRGLLC
jgi:2-polyprenyl-3-methyl-5-hydroxy-6-metoxy-1,4-benzoquinol methylase